MKRSGTTTPDSYEGLLLAIQRHADDVAEGHPWIFHSDAEDLFSLYLKNLPETERQVHNCRACEIFIRRYGDLVAIDTKGSSVSVLWGDDVPEDYAKAISAMKKRVEKSTVTSVAFLSDEIWGTPQTGMWAHFSVKPHKNWVSKKDILKNCAQCEAEKAEEFRMLRRALAGIKIEHVAQARHYLTSPAGGFIRPEHGTGWLDWIEERLVEGKIRGSRKDRLHLLAVAGAPAGFCHISTSVVGQLLDGVRDGNSVDRLRKAWNLMLDPRHYQRPQALPAAGNVQRAEEIFEKLGIARSLERRFARLEEVALVWKPMQPEEEKTESGRVFSEVKTKNESRDPVVLLEPVGISTTTWVKFARDVLPKASKIVCYVPYSGRFFGLTTAVHDDAPPILQWDRTDRRNPVCQYTYPHAIKEAWSWNLTAGSRTEVTGIARAPHHAHPDTASPQYPDGVIFILEGCRDTQISTSVLFPETLIGSLREVRATIEAWSRSHKLQGLEEASACGLGFFQNSGIWMEVRFSVTDAKGFVTQYVLDRWE